MTDAVAAARSGPAIGTRGVTMRFGAQVVLDAVTLDLAAGALTSIIGPNGAGKTTLFNVLSGQLRPTAGRVLLRGRDITRLSPAARVHLGIGRSFQLTTVFPNLTVLENVRLAVQAHRGVAGNAWRH